MRRFEGCAGGGIGQFDRLVAKETRAALHTQFSGELTSVFPLSAEPVSRERGLVPDERPGNTLRGQSADMRPSESPDRGPKSLKELERAMGIEPTTRSLGSYCSTTELHPRRSKTLARRAAAAEGGRL